MNPRFWLFIVAFSAAAGLTSGCVGGRTLQKPKIPVTGGIASLGKQIMVQRKCGSCHTVPGIPGAHGVFGPPLTSIGDRTYIAGNFPNQPNNLVHWIMSPTSMKPKTAMPDLGLSEQQARDVAAYLYTLR
ncbi:MAG: c-type cytochrome [Terriglobia bacterium]